MKILRNNLILASAAVMVSLASVTASADPAMVINPGQKGSECSGPLNPPLNGYSGYASVVSTSSGEVMVKCIGEVLGEPPLETLVIPDFPGPFVTICNVIVTKSGRFNAICHN